MASVERFRLPFQEQIAFFRQKLNVPTARWDDIWQSAHDRAFIVAGAQKADLLNDLRDAVGGYFERGYTLADFRKNFERIVAERGWTGWTGEGSKGGRAWRTRVIYTTNVASSYAAGRYQQLTDPELLAERPYWRYVHNDSVTHPRPHHKAWGDAGLTLPHDDAFWKTHYPPNGWGCRCRVKAVRAPGAGDATEPPGGWNTTDPKTGAPPGIDKGWAYAPGESVAENLRRHMAEKIAKLPPPLGADLQQAISAPPPVTLRERLAATPVTDRPREIHAWIEAHRTVNKKSYQGSTMAQPEDFYRVTWEGIEYWFPDNPAPGPSGWTNSAITHQIERLAMAPTHPRLLKAETKRVVITTQANQHDAYWAAHYNIPGFTSAGTAGYQRTVTVHNGRELTARQMAHEMAHNLATKKWGQPTPFSSSDYQAAIDSGEPPVSSYATASQAEDFAEAVMVFYENPVQLQAVAPRRYTVIERLLREPGYHG